MVTFGPLQMTINKSIFVHTSVKLELLTEKPTFYFQSFFSCTDSSLFSS